MMNDSILKQSFPIISIFIVIVIHLSESTTDLNLSDDNYKQIHNHQYSWRSERHHESPGVHNHKWFHTTNHNINGEPSAITKLGQFFSTAFNGRFPFDSKFQFPVPPMPLFRHIPPIPPVPPLPPFPSDFHLHRYPESSYWHKNYDQSNHRNLNNNNNYHYGSRNSHSNVKQWSYTQNSGHSYHYSSDNGADQNHDWNRPNIWHKEVPHRLEMHHFSHRSSIPNVHHLSETVPPVDNLSGDRVIRDNHFIKEHKFSWNIVENRPFKDEFDHFS